MSVSERVKAGRPRSEEARQSVLHAADDLLVELGYSAMTMKNIAERAGVSRQTLYRWWTTKGQILFEACAIDAEEELTIETSGDGLTDLVRYLDALLVFLSQSPPGRAYRAIVGEAQHDEEIASLLKQFDILDESARAIVSRWVDPARPDYHQLVAGLVAPVFYWIFSGKNPAGISTATLASAFMRDLPAGRASA